jgi:hypothetical protein
MTVTDQGALRYVEFTDASSRRPRPLGGSPCLKMFSRLSG